MAVQHRGDELIIIDGQSIGYSIGDFWRWSASDLLSNTLRGSYCEFLVSAALGMDMGQTYVDWEPYDIAFPYRWWCDEVEQSIIRVEVKSSAYLQAVSFNQKKLSNPTFGIAPTRLQLPDGHYSPELKRQSDVYVFGLYAEQNRAKAEPLCLDKWDFYILPTKTLDKLCGPQKTITLGSLLQLQPIKTDFDGIKDAVTKSIPGYLYPPPDNLHNIYSTISCNMTKQPRCDGAAFSSVVIIFWRSTHGTSEEDDSPN